MERVSGGLLWDLRESADMIKLQHTVFALPFALIALVSAAAGWPETWVWVWVLVAMVSARTAAMTFNRLIDHQIDLDNPRTRRRALPAGRLSRRFAWVVTAISSGLFLLAAARLNRTCLVLAPFALAVLLGYSFSKRFTALSHLWLGVALGLAPAGAWLAVTGSMTWAPVILAAAFFTANGLLSVAMGALFLFAKMLSGP